MAAERSLGPNQGWWRWVRAALALRFFAVGPGMLAFARPRCTLLAHSCDNALQAAMDPNDLIKAAPELAKGAAALGAAVPFTAIVKRMLGPAADELAEMLRDQVRLYRYERQLKCLDKAERMAKDAGFTPRAVPPKILFPLLEGASFEEDEDLHTMWAALLANAASPDNAPKVRPGFIATLKQMSPEEASILKFIADRKAPRFGPGGFYPRPWSDAENPPNIAFEDLLICLDGLEAAKLLRSAILLPPITDRLSSYESSIELDADDEGPYYLTDRGRAFLEACRPPAPKENG
jgi:Abortive infection alpha